MSVNDFLLPPYLQAVLRILYTRYETENIDFRELRPGLHFIDTPDYACLLVDSNRRMVEVSWDEVLPPNFRGRVVPEHWFQVYWIDGHGEQLANVPASSPRQACLFAIAPENAECVEVDPVRLRWPSWYRAP